jgi:GNAT superfamily N-acetyltransferase
MIESIRIRRARPEDVDAVHAIHTTAIRTGAADHYSPEALAAWVDAFNPASFPRNLERLAFFVAEIPDRGVAGFLVLNPETRELDSLYVAPRATGSGLGSYLLGFGEEWARLAGIQELWLDASVNAVPFYAKHGWQEIGWHDRIRKGVEIRVMRMDKSLIA